MGLLDQILAQPGALDQLAKTVGLDSDQARRGVKALLPAISAGVRRNARDASGLAGLLGAIGDARAEECIERPEQLADPSTREMGNALLGQLFGSKEVSRSVASQAASEAGLGDSVLKQMLPLVASLVAGSLSRGGVAGAAQAGTAPGTPDASGAESSGLAMLENLLDSDGDGQVLDDVLGFAKKFF